ncbi:hypothetical protein [Deinococcus radiotolerans]|uniref:Uncharacterized protein n=1 Tax=Deinococcus radiotolerans TaxID=1309407 RepID=A0ABQ2FQH0_9DEIO|nr:hypothetical protein [Deinococcus radiotolerans]GGL16850.1 hypothetical protein GCM10010844_39730 [Deinococcus radiotolerans]
MSGRWAHLHPVQRNYALAREEVRRVAVDVAFVQDLITLRLDHGECTEDQWAALMDQADDELGLTAARAARDAALDALLVWGRDHTEQLVARFRRRFTAADVAAMDRIFDVFTRRRELGEMLLRLPVEP